ncbi:GNAT family N-acetyltransferase [Vibrio atlanticus]|uniref:GNAT family N-acetyltransferase n=1 Tax=Vibrio atlanticus TaxID=693153 RepID=UPI0011906E8D|nr:GNAT family N-acetyltransferase [Vibrio tasmaniensis]
MNFQLVDCKIKYTKLLFHRLNTHDFAELEHLTFGSKQFCNDLIQDELSYLFCGHNHDGVVASCRLTDINNLDSKEMRYVKRFLPEELINDSVFISRLCVNPDFMGRRLYQSLLGYVCAWAKCQLPQNLYIAKCQPNYVKLYQNFGCEVINNSEHIDEYSNLEYVILLGDINKTYEIIKGK